jgi:hypothetical protein
LGRCAVGTVNDAGRIPEGRAESFDSIEQEAERWWIIIDWSRYIIAD